VLRVSENKYFIGIDVGKQGAIAVIDQNGKVIELIDMPVIAGRLDLTIFETTMQRYPQAPITFEKVVSLYLKMKGMDIFQMGFMYGMIVSYMYSNNRKYHEVRCQEWRKAFGLTGKGKVYSIIEAKKLFPAAGKRLNGKSSQIEGRGEALLQAEYSRRISIGVA
jgi:hypothetical protein